MGHFWVTMAKYIVTKTFSSLPGVRDENNNVIVKQTDLKTLFTNCRSTINWTLLKKNSVQRAMIPGLKSTDLNKLF